MVVPIILYGSPVLRKYSAEVTEEDNIQKYADDLFSTIRKYEGIGLAAPQINLLKRVFVIDTTPIEDDDLTTEMFTGIFINPEIIDKNSKNIIYREGCLSIPGIFEEVYRPGKIAVKYQDLQLKFHEEEFEGIKARIFQHEYDHLEGILFIDKINILRKKILSGKLNRIKKSSKA